MRHFTRCFFVYTLPTWLLMAGACETRQAAKPGLPDGVPALDKSIAQKPPMGWNSWDCFGWTVNEAQVRANAEYVAKYLKPLGYEYIVIDQCWYANAKDSDFEAFVQETISTKPDYSIDRHGILQPDTVKFPSARGGRGFKPLADYIHSLGLKFGLHQLRGIPWKATVGGRSIRGTSLSCESIAQPDSGCVWYDGFYGVDMKKPGAQTYYNSVFKTYADWGVDYVKVDDVVNVPELEGISRSIRSSGRKMVLSVVPENIPLDVLKQNVHMARTGLDFWDVWEMLKKGFPVASRAVKEQEPGYWPDLDMLPMGKIGIGLSYKGPEPRISNFTPDELRTLLTLWYIARMPLMYGGHLPESDALSLSLVKNEEALAVNRNSTNNRQIKFKNAIIVWAADVPNSTDKYVAFFNQWESKEPVKPRVTWQQLGLPAGTYQVRDLWAKKELGTSTDSFTHPIPAHGAGLYKIHK
jgi:alpha-galactosidase